MVVRKRSAAEMEAIAKQEKEDEEVAKRWFRAVEDQKRRRRGEAAVMEDEGGYEPTTGVGMVPVEVVRYSWARSLVDWGRYVILPGEVPVPDTPGIEGGYEPTSDQKPVGSSKNRKPRR